MLKILELQGLMHSYCPRSVWQF
uniref:Uncharacterized protein n=1 Tax=Arundo donax TaxID=35708 RepID=A0A0A9EQE9_ARUDO